MQILAHKIHHSALDLFDFMRVAVLDADHLEVVVKFATAQIQFLHLKIIVNSITPFDFASSRTNDEFEF